MEVNKIQTQGCKFPRFGNVRGDHNGDEKYPNDEEEHGEVERSRENGSGREIGAYIGGIGRFSGQPSSQIVRVSRASGGKHRNSKVLITSKGVGDLRDRSVRLPVTAAIRFYDLQDHLAYDQPSKTLEWLLKQLSDEKRWNVGAEQGLDSAEMDMEGDPTSQQLVSLSKFACSSNSETRKGSSLTLSRCEGRIVRVSRASGGKDQHSKVLTSKGLRDRRVRLSVTTAIQFYDLQDRLGYDQPSKAVEWLLKAASKSIDELPSINTSFPDTPKQLSDEKRSNAGAEQGFDCTEMNMDGDPNSQQQQYLVSMSKSACSSNSETGKGSDLTLSRCESQIVRVSQASGKKDRHSKVLTSKGLRDRRVRLSVTTAIQFYDIHDRLGYDRPSKAMEWVIKAASKSIDELPFINSSFPNTLKQLSDKKRSNVGAEQGFDSTEIDVDGDPRSHQQQQFVSLPNSACSSKFETSNGSGLTLSRCESPRKARERASGRKAEKENDCIHTNVNPISPSSFNELLTGTPLSNVNNDNVNNNTSSVGGDLNCSSPVLLAPSSLRQHYLSGFFGQIHLGNSLLPQFTIRGDHPHTDLQHSDFVPDYFIPVTPSSVGSDYNLNFTISSSLAGLNRGTLQCMKCWKASSPDCGFCALPTDKLLPGACMISNDTVKDICHKNHRLWYTRGCPSKYGWLALIGLALYIIFFSPCMGMVPWIVDSEIYPLRLCRVGGGVAAAANWISNRIVSQSFLSLTQAIGTSFTFLTVIALFFFLIFVTKTKGQPIKEVEKMLEMRAMQSTFWKKRPKPELNGQIV